MPFGAMGLSGIDRRDSIAPSQILGRRHRLEVSEVTAAGIAAQVVKLQALGHRTNEVLIQQFVDKNRFVLVADLAIALWSSGRARPKRAAVLLHNQASHDRADGRRVSPWHLLGPLPSSSPPRQQTPTVLPVAEQQ